MSVLGDVNYKAQQGQIPLKVHIDLTYRCHQRCLHCYLPEAWRRGEWPGRELDTRQVKGILDQLADAGTFFLTFSGGEVFLRPDLLDIVAYARQKDFVVSIMTSGALTVEANMVRRLKDLGVLGLYISLFSLNKAVHDSITQTRGSWAAAWRTVENCRALKLPVALNCTVMNPNYRDIRELHEFVRRERLPLRWNPDLSVRWDGLPHPPGLSLDIDQIIALEEELIDDAIVERTKENLGLPPDFDGSGCAAGISFGYITPQADVWPCLDLPWNCGSLLDREEFGRLWRDSATLKKVRKLQQKLIGSREKICHGCQGKASTVVQGRPPGSMGPAGITPQTVIPSATLDV